MARVITPRGEGGASLPAIRPSAGQVVEVGDTSAQSTAVGSTIVRLAADTDCWVAVGGNPIADTTTSAYLPAGVVEYFGCVATDKVAVIRATADGTLSVTPGLIDE